MDVNDFKVGGSKRKYMTAVGVLPEVDADGTPIERLEKLIHDNYTMADGYLAPSSGPDPSIPLYIENVSGGVLQVELNNYGDNSYEYSFDNKEWQPYEYYVEIAKGERLYVRADNDEYGYFNKSGMESFGYFQLTYDDNGECNVGGNIMSMGYRNFKDKITIEEPYAYSSIFIDCENIISAENLILPATTLANYCYESMFDNCTSLTTAPGLPATTLAESCYISMFDGCSSLTTAPELPATTLAKNCYENMFNGCTSLTTAPTLPATTLAERCYQYMFQNCTSLTTAPELPATTLADSCYISMFDGCSSLTTAPELPATTLANSCYRKMFEGCTSLTTAPELPATTLVENCYNSMFYGCTSLTAAPELPATTLAEECYRYMFDNCTSLTTAPELPATTLVKNCYVGMFYGCTSLTTAPELPATTLVEDCYVGMFYGCTSLNYIKIGATSWDASNASNWVHGVADTGTFVKAAGTTIPTGDAGIPSGWTVEEI